MAFRQIVEYPSKKLLKTSSDVVDINDITHQVVADLFDTLNVVGGFSLSAPQIGIHKRIICLKTSEFEGEMINPKILSAKDCHNVPESCLSFPGVFENIPRHHKVTIEYNNLENKKTSLDLSGTLAQIVQHEIEHLDGKSMLSHMSSMKRSMFARKIKKLQKKAADYFAVDDFEDKKIGKVKKNAHLSNKEIRLRRENRKQNR
jgi:peptide deformylase